MSLNYDLLNQEFHSSSWPAKFAQLIRNKIIEWHVLALTLNLKLPIFINKSKSGQKPKFAHLLIVSFEW